MAEEIEVAQPYRLDLTATILRRLSTNVVDGFEDGAYLRIIGEGKRRTLLRVVQSSPRTVNASLAGPGADAYDLRALVQRMLGTNVGLSPFYRAAKRVAWLAPLVEGARGVKPPCYPSVWEAAVNTIVYQHVSIFSAGAILQRVIERFAKPVRIAGVALRAFPGAATLYESDPLELRSLGLSAAKVAAIRAVAKAVLERQIDETALGTLSTARLTQSLTAIHGIGPWSAAVIALRGFGRLDVFPMKDSGVARNLKALSGERAIDIDGVLADLGPQRAMLYYHLLLHGLAHRASADGAAKRHNGVQRPALTAPG